jgi:hypothetical protein
MRVRARAAALAAVAAAALAAGCGAGSGRRRRRHPGLRLLVTRDFGTTPVKQLERAAGGAGDTVMRLLQRNADVETRYGGGFVQSIDGIAGGRRGGRPLDWFFYRNGVLPRRAPRRSPCRRATGSGGTTTTGAPSWTSPPSSAPFPSHAVGATGSGGCRRGWSASSPRRAPATSPPSGSGRPASWRPAGGPRLPVGRDHPHPRRPYAEAARRRGGRPARARRAASGVYAPLRRDGRDSAGARRARPRGPHARRRDGLVGRHALRGRQADVDRHGHGRRRRRGRGGRPRGGRAGRQVRPGHRRRRRGPAARGRAPG